MVVAGHIFYLLLKLTRIVRNSCYLQGYDARVPLAEGKDGTCRSPHFRSIVSGKVFLTLQVKSFLSIVTRCIVSNVNMDGIVSLHGSYTMSQN